ncbi:preprotein translocase subunit YajC [Gemmatimonadota bacterium]
MTVLIHALTAYQQAQPVQAPGNPIGYFLPFALIIGIFYFLIIRPQSKRQKEHKALITALQKGDKVVTAGGFHGTVHAINEEKDIVVLEIADKVRVEMNRSSISRVKKTD